MAKTFNSDLAEYLALRTEWSRAIWSSAIQRAVAAGVDATWLKANGDALTPALVNGMADLINTGVGNFGSFSIELQ